MYKFPYSDDNKRYHTLYYHNMHVLGHRVYKAPLDAGFTCPNIDGTKGFGGCIYCDGGSGYFTNKATIPLSQQLDEQIQLIHQKHENAMVTAYFQSYTNTYAPLERLKAMYEQVLENPFVEGISIATRADCLDDKKIQYLSTLSKRINLTIELGLQTVHDSTADAINRCHTFEEFKNTFCLLKENNIRTCVHIINGLPNENEDMMLKTAETLGKMRPDALKIHLLHVIKGTRLAQMYKDGEYQPMNKEDYVRIVVKQLELIPKETVIERITGDGDKRTLLAPLWSANKIAVLGAIDKLQAQLDSYQGKLLDIDCF